MFLSVILWIVSLALVALGLVGTVVPALPGAPLVFIGLLLAAMIDGFQRVGGSSVAILAGLMLLTLAVDVLATVLGAKRVRASALAVIGAGVGTIVGLFFGLIGILFAPFVGAVLGQFLSERDLLRAGKVGLATWLGMLCGIAVKLALIFLMIAYFVLAYAL